MSEKLNVRKAECPKKLNVWKLNFPEPLTVVILLFRSKGRTCETNRFGPMKFHYCDKVGHCLILIVARATEKGKMRARRDLLHNTRSATGFPF